MTESRLIQILLIGEMGSTQEQIETAFGNTNEFQLAGVITDLDRLSIEVSALEPDMILIDDSIQGNTVDVIDDLALRFPAISIVVLLPDDNPVTVQQVTLAGARAFIIKPFTQVNLVNTLRRVRTLDAARKRIQPPAGPGLEIAERALKTVTVYSPKGGVGCTTIAANLALAYYQEHGGRVLLMEGMHHFSHLDVSLNILTGNSVMDLIPHASNLDDTLIDDVVYHHNSGVHILLGPRDVQTAQGIRADSLFSVYMALRRLYDFIVIDAGSGLNENSVTLMDSADRILLLTTPDLPTLHDTSKFVLFSPTLAIPLEKFLIVVNRSGVEGGVRMRDIESSLRQNIFAAIPDDGPNAIRSLNRGVPLVLRYPRSPASRAIKDLARKLGSLTTLETLETARVAGAGE